MMSGTIRPFVFIGSSVEGLDVAKAIQAGLEHSAECMIWSQGIFGLSQGGLEALVKRLNDFDFAVLALTPDDLSRSRETDRTVPRDNVLLELGMFIGALGRERTFMVVDRTVELKLPSDLAGITPATYHPPDKGTYRSSLGSACSNIEEAIKTHGLRGASGSIDVRGGFSRGFTDDEQAVTLTVVNRSDDALPPYTLYLYHPRVGSYTHFSSIRSGPQLPRQVREHSWPIIQNGQLIEPLPSYLRGSESEIDDDGFRLRLLLEDSDGVVLAESKRVGLGLLSVIRATVQHGSIVGGDRANDPEMWTQLWDVLHLM